MRFIRLAHDDDDVFSPLSAVAVAECPRRPPECIVVVVVGSGRGESSAAPPCRDDDDDDGSAMVCAYQSAVGWYVGIRVAFLFLTRLR